MIRNFILIFLGLILLGCQEQSQNKISNHYYIYLNKYIVILM